MCVNLRRRWVLSRMDQMMVAARLSSPKSWPGMCYPEARLRRGGCDLWPTLCPPSETIPPVNRSYRTLPPSPSWLWRTRRDESGLPLPRHFHAWLPSFSSLRGKLKAQNSFAAETRPLSCQPSPALAALRVGVRNGKRNAEQAESIGTDCRLRTTLSSDGKLPVRFGSAFGLSLPKRCPFSIPPK